jgi:hypothetical protein
MQHDYQCRRRAVKKYHRHSLPKGTFEATYFRPIDKRTRRVILVAVKRKERLSREKGQRNGALGHVAVEVMEYLLNIVHPRTGRLDPALTTIMKAIGRSRDAVVRALKALREHKFLSWEARIEAREDDDGPVVKQASNAYRIELPEMPPIPEDAEQRLVEQRRERERCERWIDPDSLLARAIARGRNAFKPRESADRTESLILDSSLKRLR